MWHGLEDRRITEPNLTSCRTQWYSVLMCIRFTMSLAFNSSNRFREREEREEEDGWNFPFIELRHSPSCVAIRFGHGGQLIPRPSARARAARTHDTIHSLDHEGEILSHTSYCASAVIFYRGCVNSRVIVFFDGESSQVGWWNQNPPNERKTPFTDWKRCTYRVSV